MITTLIKGIALRFGIDIRRYRAPTTPGEIALTFDDGPSQYTSDVLGILQQYRCPATFFLVGRNVDQYPDLARSIVSSGSEVGNHSYAHPRLVALDPHDVRTELLLAQSAILRATGVWPVYFRPPYGKINRRVERIVRSIGLRTVLWTALARDYESKNSLPSPRAAEITHLILDEASDGGIVLFHDYYRETVVALSDLLQELQVRGFRCVTVGEVLRRQAYLVAGLSGGQPFVEGRNLENPGERQA